MERPVRTVRIGDRRFQLTGLDQNDPYFASIGDGYEEAFTTFCRRHLADDAVCLDIGANIGVKTMALSRAVPRGRVVALEPGPVIADVLDQNVEANELENVDVLRAAVGDRDGEVTFLPQSAYGHIATESGDNTVTVPITRLETVMQQQGLNRLDFVKIDVEGFEFPIVRDALPLFNAHETVVMLEFNSWCQLAFADVNSRGFISWLFDHFAYVARVTAGGESGELLARVDAADALDLLHQNLVYDGCVTDLVVTNHPDRRPRRPTRRPRHHRCRA